MAAGASYENVLAANLIREDVVNQIADLSMIRKPLLSRIGRRTHGNEFFEWPLDRLQAPDTSNAAVEDAAPSTAENYLPTYPRVGNYTQISDKLLKFTEKQLAADGIAQQNTVSRQTARRMEELTRDMEAILLSGQGSNPESGSTAGLTAGMQAWVCDEDEAGGTIYNATAGNPSQYRFFNTGTITVDGWANSAASDSQLDAVAYSGVTAGAFTEEGMHDLVEALYNRGYDDNKMFTAMTRPSLCRRISQFGFTSSARISTLVNQGSDSTGKRTAQGAIQYWQTDFGTLELVANRLMQLEDAGNSDSTSFLVFDPDMIRLSLMTPFRTKRDQTASLVDSYLLFVHYGLEVRNWTSIACGFGIDAAATMTAS